MPTLLITTPAQDNNSFDDKVLLLGEWCRLYTESKYPANIDVHKYHWDDRDKFTKDCNYLNDLYEKYLLYFSSILNKFHNKNEDTRYWRIIIGPWLKYFIDVIFDRFECIRTLGDKKIDNTYVFKYNLEDLIPDDFSCFYDQIRSDGWNHAIFSECIIYFGINHTLLNYSPYRSNISSKNSKQKLKNKLLNIYNSVFPRIFNSIAIIEPYTDIYKTIKLNIALGQFPIFGTNANERNINKLDKFRGEFISNNSLTSPFEYFLEKLIFKLIPFSYLENLATIEKSSLSKYPLNPKLIFTSNAYQANDLFKIWAAKFVTNGIPLIIAQHGGHYGIGLVNQTEVHQLKISSVFASWGWGNTESITTMPSLKLNNSFTFKYKRNGKILITTPSYPRYFYCSFSVPLSGQFLYYLNDLFVFLNGINEKKNILIRTDADIFGWNIHKRIVDNNFGWAIDKKNIKLIDSLKESKIAISTYNATIFLETLSMNFPTLVYFDFKYYEIREDAQESISILLDANILHKSAVNAYQFLNSLNGEIESWWFSKSVQNARLVFCNKFARASSNCISEWKIFLNNNKNG